MALILLPVVVAYAILYREMSPIPLLDDYDAIFAFLLHQQQLSSLGGKLLYIVEAQHVAYKLIFEHLVLYVQFLFIKRVSLVFLIVFGNFFLAVLLAIYWKAYFADEKDLTRRLILFLPVSYLLFSLNFAETVDWAMAGLQNLPVIFFSFAAIFFLTRSGRRGFGRACFCSALACMSSANGFLLAPIGLFVLLAERNYRRTIVWSGTFGIVLAMYLYHYVRGTAVPAASVHVKGIFLLSFLGAGVENMHHHPIKDASVALGMMILLTFCHAIYTRYDRDHPFAFLSAAWILLTAILVADIRSSFGAEQSLSGRYKIYCNLLLIFCYGYAVHRLKGYWPKQRWLRLYALTLVAVIGFNVASDIAGFKFLVRRRKLLDAGMKLYLADPANNSPVLNPNDAPLKEMGDWPEFARIQMNHAIERKIYVLPQGRF